MALIEARGLRKTFGPTIALDGVNLRVEEGRILGLIGPNGAGKTTAIDIAVGLRRADSGNVSLFGKRPSDLAARRRLGATPQESGFPDGTSSAPNRRSCLLCWLRRTRASRPAKPMGFLR